MRRRIGGAQAALCLALAALGGCSWVPDAVNPISWYRDLSGAAKNDALDKDQRNQQNLAAGGKEPYPNLADVPDVPDRARSALDRDALQKSLVADRANAHYTDERLRAGVTSMTALIPPPAPEQRVAVPIPSGPAAARPAAVAAAAAEAPPVESSLKTPTVRSLPQGEMPEPPPAPPKTAPRTPVVATPLPEVASAASGRRLDVPASSVAVAEIVFAGGSAALTDDERNRLSGIAATQHKDGGTIRVVGHPDPAAPSAQPLDAFTLALDRAKAVAAALTAEGVAETAIAVETARSGAGSDQPPRADVFLEK